MALEVAWYDIVCFGIVGVSFVGALWVLWMKEGASRREFESIYESILVARPDNEVVVDVLPKGHVSTSQLWTSCWGGVHPLWLLATRFLSFVVMALFLVWDVLKYDASIFIYYTEWTFTLVTIYFALGTIVSAYGCWQFVHKPAVDNRGRAEFLRREEEEERMSINSMTYREKETAKGSFKLQSRNADEEFQHRAGFWGYLMQTTYQVGQSQTGFRFYVLKLIFYYEQTCAGAVMLTDVVFWCVIVPFLSISHFRLNLLMGCMHSLNVVFLLLDTALNNLPFPWFRISYFVLWTCVYAIFQWVIHAFGFTWWPYPFLELNNKWAPLWYFCLAVIHIPCYGMYSLIVRAKITFLPRFFPHAFLRPY